MSATPPVVADSVSSVLTKRERILCRTATGFANDNRPLLAGLEQRSASVARHRLKI